MKIKKLESINAFVAVDLEDVPGRGILRAAKKILQGGAKDLARSLSVISVRIVDVIPGKPYIGLEIPNENRELVTLGEILNTSQYESINSSLALVTAV